MKTLFIRKRLLIFLLIAVVLVASMAVWRTAPAFKSDTKPADKPIYCVECEERKVAISFDAAWGSAHTQGILDILDSRNVKATFFLVGFWVDKFPDLVREIDRRGHEIGNHSSTHPHMSKLSCEQMKLELQTTNDAVERLIDKRPEVFRPPFGDYSPLLVNTVKDMKMHTIQWDVDSLDWKELGVEHMVDRVMSRVKNGSIILFHNNSKYITQALPIILDKLKKEGYEIVPVGNLIHKSDYYVDIAGVQHGK